MCFAVVLQDFDEVVEGEGCVAEVFALEVHRTAGRGVHDDVLRSWDL